ncbi:hypothetical protein ACFQ1M_06950 [Sungkyunkwania multivorans]|uniref:PNPLA domain-containing protein n=1 Tax=Sungkyunkwania multivorans TaxID=1173618 RepID=A0ABW3CXA4_9FLAO
MSALQFTKSFLSKSIGYARIFFFWFSLVLKELGRNIVSVLMIGLTYFLLWHFPQTLDLLLILNQVDSVFNIEVPLYFSLLTLLAYLIWYSANYLDRKVYDRLTVKKTFTVTPNQIKGNIHKSQNVSTSTSTGKVSSHIKRLHVRKTMPKVLGFLLITISALAILNAAEQFGIDNVLSDIMKAETALLLTFIFMLLMLNYTIYSKFRKFLSALPKKKWFFYLASFSLVVIIILLGMLNNQDKQSILNLFIANCILAFLFLGYAFLSNKLLSEKTQIFIHRISYVLIAVVVMLFFVFSVNPEFSRKINPLSVIMVSLIIFYMTAFGLGLLGKKYRIPLLAIVVVFCFLYGKSTANRKNFRHYEIDYVEAKSSQKRTTLNTHIENWISERKAIIDSSATKYPIIFVSSEGGGSRAGLWAFLVHSYLNDAAPSYYSDHLFSLSGASGGGVGNSMFYSKANEAFQQNKTFNFKSDKPNGRFKYRASEVYKNNYLSSSLAALLGRDLFQSTFGILPDFPDRGSTLEGEWEAGHLAEVGADEDRSLLSRNVLSFYKKNEVGMSPPLLMINTTHAQTGQYAVISPVDFRKDQECRGFRDFLDDFQQINPNKSIKLSTAMSLNARFPFVSPAGEVKGVGQFADAGYYDNIGGTVSINLQIIFRKVLQKKFPELLNKIEIINLVINNDDEEQIDHSKPMTQLQAPLSTLINIRSGHTKEKLEDLGKTWQVTLKKTPIYTEQNLMEQMITTKAEENDSTLKDEPITPILPLGRYLSNIAIRSIEARLETEEVKKKLDLLASKMNEIESFK